MVLHKLQSILSDGHHWDWHKMSVSMDRYPDPCITARSHDPARFNDLAPWKITLELLCPMWLERGVFVSYDLSCTSIWMFVTNKRCLYLL